MLIAFVMIDHFPYKFEEHKDVRLKKRNVVIFHKSGTRSVIMDTSPGLIGVNRGMSLQEISVSLSDVITIEADIDAYNREFNSILIRLGNRSPVVEPSSLGSAYVGLDGLNNTYGSEGQLVDVLLQAVPDYMKPRVGVSNGKFLSYLAAMTALDGGAYRTPDSLEDFLSPWPIEILPVDSVVKDRLRSFGFYTLGHLAKCQIGPIQAQFGKIGARIWYLSRGIDDEPLTALKHSGVIGKQLNFAAPIIEMKMLLIAFDNLLGSILANPEMSGRYARTVLLEGIIYNRGSWQKRIVFKTPVGNRLQAMRIIKSSLEGIRLPGPLESISLTLGELTGEIGHQGSLFREVRRHEHLAQAIKQLAVSQGSNPVLHVVEVEPWSRIPERRLALMTYDP